MTPSNDGALRDPWTYLAELTEPRVPGDLAVPARTAADALANTVADVGAARASLVAAAAGDVPTRATAVLDGVAHTAARRTVDLGAAADCLDAIGAAQERVRGVTAVAVAPLAAALRWFGDAAVTAPLTRAVLADLDAARDVLHADLETVATQLDRLVAPHELAAPARDGPPGVDPNVPAPATAPSFRAPPAGGDGTAVAGWWAGLSPAEQAAAAREPRLLAALPGLPGPVLDAANRALLETDRTAVEPLRRDTAGRIDALLRDATVPGRPAPLLLRYRPGSPGGYALSYGDPTAAGVVAVTIPGTGTDPLGGDSTAPRQAGALYDALLRTPEPNGHPPSPVEVAVVHWVDVDLPDSILDLRVTDPATAALGGRRLAADAASWRAAHPADAPPRLTLVGHSYGSTVAGLAAHHGAGADEVILLGSPGAGVDAAADLGGARAWAFVDEHDPVVGLTRGGWFDTDPGGRAHSVYAPEFGGRTVEATTGTRGLGSHGTYHEGAALEAIAVIVLDPAADPPAPGSPTIADGLLAQGTASIREFGAAAAAAGRRAWEGEWDAAGSLFGQAASEALADAGDLALSGAAGVAAEGWEALRRLRRVRW